MYTQIIYQERNMITYQDLCSGLSQLQDDNINNRQDLITAIRELAIFTAEDLGLLDKTWKDLSGNLNHYLSILDLTDRNKPKVTLPSELKYTFDKRNVFCEFGIQITLEKDSQTYPKTNVYTVLSAQKLNGKVSITVKSSDGDKVFNIEKPYNQNFSDLNDAIKQSIINFFK